MVSLEFFVEFVNARHIVLTSKDWRFIIGSYTETGG
jgi:hypothetical protein